MPGIVFLSGGQTEMGKLEALSFASYDMKQMICFIWYARILTVIFRCNKESQWNEQDSRESMETFF